MTSALHAPTADSLITPHGGTLIDRLATGAEADALRERAATLPVVTLTDTQASDLEMIAVGAMSPLDGFLGQADYERVVRECRLADGTVWSLPITLRVHAADEPDADVVALASPEGQLLAIMEITERYTGDKELEAEHVFRTTEVAHPGVAIVYAQGDVILGGPIQAFDLQPNPFSEYMLTPRQTRAIFAERGWKTAVGFQTRNPIHRAHEYIVKTAMEVVDGVLLHPLVGRTKEGDISAEVRLRCYEVLLANYFPANHAQLAVFPAAMRYAGPREAIFHALTRKNYGCTHFIVGRDHAGVGGYYGTYDAQAAFEPFSPEELGVTILKFEQSFYCKHCKGMGSAKTCPHDVSEHLTLSGTRVREMLAEGTMPPPEFSRPEVAELLIEEFRSRG
ncbi:MAG: sat [Thermoleophilia bacterium]|nr:sat [Thermoleophilia bacterium]